MTGITDARLIPGLLRSLARELDAEADACGAACDCEGHYARRHLASDLAATYRTRALHYEADPEVIAGTARVEALMGALDRMRAQATAHRSTGTLDVAGLFRVVSRVLDAYEAYAADRLVGK